MADQRSRHIRWLDHGRILRILWIVDEDKSAWDWDQRAGANVRLDTADMPQADSVKLIRTNRRA
jgi:hypothetical protein